MFDISRGTLKGNVKHRDRRTYFKESDIENLINKKSRY